MPWREAAATRSRFAAQASDVLAAQIRHLAWPERCRTLDGYFTRQAAAMLGTAYFPIDLDAQSTNLDKAVTLDSVELESVTDVKKALGKAGYYTRISEDDFELLAELLTELTEDDDDDEDIEDEEEFED
jgi:hypothetical protein